MPWYASIEAYALRSSLKYGAWTDPTTSSYDLFSRMITHARSKSGGSMNEPAGGGESVVSPWSLLPSTSRHVAPTATTATTTTASRARRQRCVVRWTMA